MKKSCFIPVCIFFTFYFMSCHVNDSDDNPDDLGGEPNLTLGQVGNTITTGSVGIGNQYYDVDASIEITANNNGVATLKVSADLSQIPGLADFNNFIPASLKDSSGKINCELHYKVTSEGMQDDLNKDRKLYTLVKYDAKVGDKYQLQCSNGKTITRQVTERTDQDDFPYGFMYIKTIKVEQDSRIPGVSKIIYRLNHRFGLVYIEMIMEDGSSAYLYLFPTNT